MGRIEVSTVQIGKAYIPVLNALSKKKKTSMRKYIEVKIVEDAAREGIIVKKSEGTQKP